MPEYKGTKIAFSALRSLFLRHARAFALLWTLLVFAVLSVPSSGVPSSGVPHLDKLVHVALFAGLGLLWMGALLPPHGSHRFRSAAGHVLVAGAVYGVLLEAYQGLLPALGRSADVLDAAADVAGLLLALLLYVGARRFHQVSPP